MNNQTRTVTAAASHSEIVTVAFHVVTIALAGLFSALLLLNAAAQIV